MASPAKDDDPKPSPDAEFLKYLSMVLLIIQNTFSVLFMKYATSRDVPRFENASAVIMTEVVKMIVCFAIILQAERGSLNRLAEIVFENIFVNYKEMMKMGVPSMLYTFQNFMVFVAINNLSPAAYTCAFQSKLIFTALNSMLIFGRQYSTQSWISLFMLAGGVAMVQLKGTNNNSISDDSKQSQFVGLSAAISACFSSGIAGVYMEMVLKGKGPGLWVKNIQLATWGILVASMAVCLDESAMEIYRSSDDGFFHGFDWAVWVIVVANAAGGLLVASVMKYANAVVKGIAISIAVILTTILSVIIFKSSMSGLAILGVVTVSFAVHLWNTAPKPVDSS